MNLKKQKTQESSEPLQKKIQKSLLQRFIGFLAVIVVLILGWFLLYYQPTKSQISKYSAEVTQWVRKIKMASVSKQAVENLEIETTELEKEISKIEEKIYYLEDMDVIAQKLLAYARDHRLKVISMVPKYDVLFPLADMGDEFKPLVKLPLEIKMVGRFIRAGKFVEDVHTLPFLFAPNEIFFESDPNLYPNVKVVVNGYLFLLNESKAGKAEKEPVGQSQKRKGG